MGILLQLGDGTGSSIILIILIISNSDTRLIA